MIPMCAPQAQAVALGLLDPSTLLNAQVTPKPSCHILQLQSWQADQTAAIQSCASPASVI